MSSISNKTVKALLANSGNKCAYPGCTATLINEQFLLVAQLAHIEGSSIGGPRYNALQSDEERHGYKNLMFLCYPHHKEIDASINIKKYTVKKLTKFKIDHEENCIHTPFQIDGSHIYRITQEVNKFWNDILELNQNHISDDMMVKISVNSTFDDLYVSILHSINHYNDMWLNCLSKEEQEKHWELFNIGMYNHTINTRVTLLQMHIRYLEEYLKTNVKHQSSKNKLQELREELKRAANTATYSD